MHEYFDSVREPDYASKFILKIELSPSTDLTIALKQRHKHDEEKLRAVINKSLGSNINVARSSHKLPNLDKEQNKYSHLGGKLSINILSNRNKCYGTK